MSSGRRAENIILLGRPLLSVKFLLAVFILAAASTGLRPFVRILSENFQKEPARLRRSLETFDASCLPSFRSGWKYSRKNAPVEDIGTNEYMHIAFTKPKLDRDWECAELFVTYYNNPRDKVPHTPEVCSRQTGTIVTKLSTIMLDIPELPSPRQKIKARLLFLQEPKFNVVDIYVFCVEGRFKYSREQVRWGLAKPGNRFSYFSKVEAAVTYPIYSDPSEALQLCKQLICEALPVLVAEYFPDSTQLKRR